MALKNVASDDDEVPRGEGINRKALKMRDIFTRLSSVYPI